MTDPDDTNGDRLARGHVPVMVDQALDLLNPRPGQSMLDATVGRGGHAAALMPRLAPGGRYIALDLDADNVEHVRRRFAEPPVELIVRHADFADAGEVLRDFGQRSVDLLLADLGFASTQMDAPARGLSFSGEGPLDMRLDRDQATTAADLVNRLKEPELSDILWRYGEERLSRKIARKIVEQRQRQPITTTRELADLCVSAYGPRGRRQRIHPATRTFMALRIAVNQELDRLETLLSAIPSILAPGGHAAIISFHSLEDRAVKWAFRGYADAGRAELLTRKPLTPDDAEQAANPRSRSAKLRGLRWIETASNGPRIGSNKDDPRQHPRTA
jgi:16S rRNA (cytosine1402-N4)-methyltransferase